MNQKESRRALREYLDRFRIAKLKQEQLKKRHDFLSDEINSPLAVTGYNTIPITGGGVPDGAVGVIYRIADIENCIRVQQDKMVAICLKIMELLDCLPPDSEHRLVLELKYIDNKSWRQIAGLIYRSVDTCRRLEREALNEMLEYDRVKNLVGAVSDA